MKTAGIYRIDLGNNNFYIGSAVNLTSREQQHRNRLKRGVHHNIFVQNCWNKYGVFGFTVLEECAKDDLLLREQFYIDQHRDNPKMTNICLVAGSPLGIKHSDETRARMSAVQMGRVHSDESRANQSAAQMGHGFSDERRANMSAAQKLRIPPSAETRIKLSVAARGRVHSDESRAKISAALTGVPKSADACAKRSLALLAYWSKIRLEKTQLLKEVA